MGNAFGRAGVVGLGTMGAGIVEVLARGGLDVVGIEINDEALARGRSHLEASTGRAVKRGRLTEQGQREILGRIRLSTSFDDLADRDLVIEAVPERLELKSRVFAELDRVCRPDAVLATNTSSLSVTEIAVTTGRPASIVGVHFFNPAPVMKLVEVISTVLTDAGKAAKVTELVEELGKTPVAITDRAGFVANRLLLPYLNQAAAMYDAGHATREDIDAAMKLGTGLPMGPLTLSDLIGLDILLEAMEAIFAETRDQRHAPAPILRRLVTAGLLGRKTGRGFYRYDKPGSATVVDVPEEAQETAGLPLVGVVGSGELAVNVVAAAARAGAEVRFVAGDDAKVTGAWLALEERLRGEEKAALERITGSPDLARLADCDLIVEAVAEDTSVKRSLFATVDDVAKPSAVLATTSSTTPVIELAMASDRPASVVGLHFPEPDGRVVEVTGTDLTDEPTLTKARALARRLGFEVVSCRDRAGFVVDALRLPYLNDAARMLEDGYASAEDIDAAMRLGCGYPIGPIEDIDRLGLERVVGGLRALYADNRQAAPAAILDKHRVAGRALRA